MMCSCTACHFFWQQTVDIKDSSVHIHTSGPLAPAVSGPSPLANEYHRGAADMQHPHPSTLHSYLALAQACRPGHDAGHALPRVMH